MFDQRVAGLCSRRQSMMTGGIISSPPPAAAEPPTADTHPLAPPYGSERPDYATWKYGYPPFCGRMFGSGR